MKNLKLISLFIILFVPGLSIAKQHTITGVTLAPVTTRDANNLSFDEIGTLKPKDHPFPADMWKNSKRSEVELLLKSLPIETPSASAFALKKKLLLSSQIPPRNGKPDNSLLSIRAKHLALMGEKEELEKILAQIPKDIQPADLLYTYYSTFIINNSITLGCAALVDIIDRYPTPQFREQYVLCKAFEKDFATAELARNLLDEEENYNFPESLESFYEYFQGNKGERKKALEAWRHHEKDLITKSLSTKQRPLALQKITAFPFFDKQMFTWWGQNKSLPEAEMLSQLSRFYSIAEALGKQRAEKRWDDMTLFMASKKIYAPTLPFIRMVDLTARDSKFGETIAYTIYLLSGQSPSQLSTSELSNLIETLTTIGLKKEAKDLGKEAVSQE